MTRRDAVAGLLVPLGMLTTFFASAPWLRAFPTGTIAALLAGAAFISVALPWAVARWAPRTPAWWSMAGSVVLFVAYTLLAVLRDPVGVVDLVRGFVHGPTLVLTETLPIAAPRWVMVVPVALCWAMGATTAELLVRTGRVTLAAGIWPAGFVIASVATAGGLGTDAGWAALFVVSEGTLLFCHRWLADVGPAAGTSEGRPAVLPARSLLVGALSLLVVALVGALVLPSVPRLKGTPTVPARTPPVSVVAATSPLAQLTVLRIGSTPGPLFTVRLSAPAPGYVAVADLDVYDGSGWGLPEVFSPTGGDVATPVAPISTPAGEVVQQQYVIRRDLPFPWMPYLDRPLSVTGLQVKADRNSGMIVPPAALRAGTAYDVTSRAAAGSVTSLTAAQRAKPFATSVPADVAVPASESSDLKGILEVLEGSSHKTSSPTLAFVVSLERYFHDHYALLSIGRPGAGHAPVGDLATSFADVANQIQGQGGKGTGTPEQFATLFALLVRELGVPARVVTGFRITPPTAEAQPGVVYRVTEGQAWTWVEVPVAGVGWVVVDPSPSRHGAAPQQAHSAAPLTTTTHPQAQAQPSPANVGHNLAPRVRVKVAGSPTGFPWVVVGPVLGALAIIAVLLIPTVRRDRRRRRRSRGSPRQRVIGAWQETLDNLTELEELRVAPLTATEVVAVTRSSVGPEAADRLADLADLADLAIFSPDAPIDEADATRAWRDQAAARHAVAATMEPLERVRASVRVAPARRPTR